MTAPASDASRASKPRFALISCTDKSGVVEFARGLIEIGFSVLSTGGTQRVLQDAGVSVTSVADHTGFPEVFGGRVKTLHPKIHGGLLAPRGDADAERVMIEHGIDCIDVVAINLYRFREAAARPDATDAEIVEQIDIGGPAMLRSAAKNHQAVTVVVDPGDYTSVLEGLRGADIDELTRLRRRLAGKAFAHTASYDTAVASWFARTADADHSFAGWSGVKQQGLRYGENPHQDAVYYRDANALGGGLASARQLNGKELSYNNLLDLDAALELVREFEQPGCAIIKHNNPCGAAVATDLPAAFGAALDGDPVSAFGGIVACNRPLSVDFARHMVDRGTFFEAIVAPAVDPAAVDTLRTAKWGANLRILAFDGELPPADRVRFRQVSGGFLVQSADAPATVPELDVRTERAPTDAEVAVMRFAWSVCKHVKSNAIVLARASEDGTGFATVGVGAGQMSRVDAVRIAVAAAKDRAAGAGLASDAFFPFADGLELALQAGVGAVIQPGGSRRDDEVIAAANRQRAAMVFTGRRHFRH